MQLWIDVGNTRLKWQLYSGNQFKAEGAVFHEQGMATAAENMISTDAFVDGLGNESVSFAGVASVLNEKSTEELLATLKLSLGVIAVRARVQKQYLGLSCAYQYPEKLGVDRWLAILSVFNEHKQLSCVISCGSAFTVDVVRADGEHLGGFILPGLQMSVDALFGGTHSVRFDRLDSEPSLDFGIDTAGAVCNGILFQKISVISRLKSVLEASYPGQTVLFVLTGGDAWKIGSLLSKEGDMDFAIKQDLVIQGLRLALQSESF